MPNGKNRGDTMKYSNCLLNPLISVVNVGVGKFLCV
jgi:hypothetical protein